METWKFKLVDLYSGTLLETVEAEVDDTYGILWGLEEAAKKVVLDNQSRYPGKFLDCDPETASWKKR